MNDKEFYGTVEFTVAASITPWDDPNEYVHEVTGRALVLARDDDFRAVGEIELKLVCATEAINRGVSLWEICDADSTILEAIYSTFFDAQEEVLEEFDVEGCWSNLIFIDDIRVEPGYENSSLRVQLIETAVATFGSDAIVVAIEESLNLTIDEWKKLGFKRIADSPFVYRDQMKLNPYEPSEIDDTDLGDGFKILGADEAAYICDACGEEIVVPLDLSAGSHQTYVEDCPICCRPNIVHMDIDEDGNIRVWAEPEQDFER